MHRAERTRRPGRGPSHPAVPGGEDVPLPRVRPRDPARSRPRGRRAVATRPRTAGTGTRRAGAESSSGADRPRTRPRSRRSPAVASRVASTDATSKRSVPRTGARVRVEPAHRQGAQASLLGDRHRFRGRAERGAAPGLHLAEHEHPVAGERRGRAHPRGSASCGRARRSRRPRTSGPPPPRPRRRAPGRRVGGHALRRPGPVPRC